MSKNWILHLSLILSIIAINDAAQAACDNFNPMTGQTTTCNSSPPNPTTTNIQAANSSTNVLINILEGSILSITRTTYPVAVEVLNSSQINNNGTISLIGGGGSGTNRGAALLGAVDKNTLSNTALGLITTTGAFNDGMAANGADNTLINQGIITTTGPNAYGMTTSWGQVSSGTSNNTLINNGSVTTSGSNARAISILGQNGIITNTGTLLTTGNNSPAAYIQGNNGHLTNSGLIHTSGSSSDAVFSNTVGGSFTGEIHNLVGGSIISDQASAIRTLNGATKIINAGLLQGATESINGGNGNLDLLLQTGSQIIGLANGGGGNNEVSLEGTGLLTNPFINFQTLYMQGSDWTWQGSGDFQNSFIQTGSFRLQNSFTGNVNISNHAKLLVAQGAQPVITPSPATAAPITVTNSGTIDLGIHSVNAAETLTILGNYVGNNGALNLKSVLNTDSSPSNTLIISDGSATGKTSIYVSNLNGNGAATTNNGILLVQALNGATTADDAFILGSPAAAGAYEYLLFKGGTLADSNENWYLRSSFYPTANNPILNPSDLPPPTPGATLNTNPGVIFYRMETALYSAIKPVIKLTALSILGTFHERRGEQSMLTASKPLSASWGRVYGHETRKNWAGTVSPSFKGSDAGFQIGLDLLSIKSAENHRDNAGFLGGYAHSQGSVKGDALGWLNYQVGHLNFDSKSVGAYWTHLGPSDWYLDAVLLQTWFDGRAKSNRGIGIEINNKNFLASLEGGYPILLSRVKLEPQGQIIWQNLSANREQDRYSFISFPKDNNFTGRVGMRLQTDLLSQYGLFQPYLKANFWHNFSNSTETVFQTTEIITPFTDKALELGGGLVHAFSDKLSAFIVGDYTFNVSGKTQKTWGGNTGLRARWG